MIKVPGNCLSLTLSISALWGDLEVAKQVVDEEDQEVAEVEEDVAESYTLLSLATFMNLELK